MLRTRVYNCIYLGISVYRLIYCMYIYIYICMYIWYIISLALTKIFIFKEATRNHIKFFFSIFSSFFGFLFGVFFFSFLYTKSVLLAVICYLLILSIICYYYICIVGVCMCVFSMQYICVNNKPIAQWRENLVRLHLPKKKPNQKSTSVL